MCYLRASGKPGENYDMRWTDFQDWARRYDMRRILIGRVKDRPKQTVQARDLAKNDTNFAKTRSGRVGNVSAVETDHESPRGRSDYRSDNRRGYTRSGSRGSTYSSDRSQSRSRDPSRDRTKSPYRRNAGHTPHSGKRQSVEFSKTPDNKANGSNNASVAVIQVPINWISVNLLSTLKLADSAAETDRSPIVISTLPAHIIQEQSAIVNVSAVTRRPNNPEPIAQEDLDGDAEPMNLPEAMRRGLRQVQNLPVNNPYAKVLGANFYLTFRQLAGLCLDDEFSSICRQLLEVSLRREGKQQNMTNARAAAEIMRMVLTELPHSRADSDRVPVSVPPLQATAHAIMAGKELEINICRMAEVQAFVDDQEEEPRKMKIDSGASVSCISETAFQQDRKFLLAHGKMHSLLTPMTLSGLTSAHTKVTQILETPRFVIGKAACSHSFLVVPGLVCDYMLGQDFLLAYDMHIKMRDGYAKMRLPRSEWIGDQQQFKGSQNIDVGLGWTKAVLKVKNP